LLRIKYISGNETDTIKIKKLPVYLGSKKGVNILPFHIANMEPIHGSIYNKKNKLFYQDKSRAGSVVNNNFIKSKKIQLKPGDNELVINNNRFIIENNIFYSDYTINTSFYSKMKSISSLISLTVLLILLFLFYMFFFKSNSVQATGFNLTFDTLYIGIPFQLKNVTQKDGSECIDSTLSYSLIFDEKDSVTVKKNVTSVYLPKWLIAENELEKNIKITLGIKQANKSSYTRIFKSYILSNRIKVFNKNGIQLKLKLIRNLLDYELSAAGSKIGNIEVNFGDGSKRVNTLAAPKTYSSDGVYSFMAKVYINGNDTPVVFSTPVIIKSE